MFCLTGTYACIAAGGAGSDPVDPDPVDTGTGTGTGCPTCGTIKKTGQRSCCAPGGSWLDNCGGPGDSNFDHTWVEGVQVCNGAASKISSNVRSETFVASKSYDGPDFATVDSKGCGEVSNIVSGISLVLVMLYSKM